MTKIKSLVGTARRAVRRTHEAMRPYLAVAMLPVALVWCLVALAVWAVEVAEAKSF